MKAEAVEGEEVVGEMADGTPLTLPVIEYDSGSGPSFFVGCTIHGDEVTGQASVWKLRDLIASTGIRGRLTIVPVMNPLGFNYNVRGIPIATIDLNRLYPGDPEGSLSERITAKIWSISRQHEYIVDVHTAGWCIPHILVDPVGGELKSRVEEFTAASGITVLQEYEEERYRLQNLAASLPGVALKDGKVALTVELGGFKGIDWASVDAGFICLRNMLIKAGLIKGRLEVVTSAPVISEKGYRRTSIFSTMGGLLRYEVVPGAKVRRDDMIAEIRDVYGRLKGEARAPTDGYIVSLNATSVVPSGGHLAELAVTA
ncbi:MAG: succinylglutamate desuccinylase/aspartoacylase family protein [Candidatus Thermoplasmatota archaeon]|nr:succinylglutamate desuccinylase/aspartoacylase family protein [Candidatus Thermoplasmatota archaeon]